MSSIIEGYNYDIFISYRQKDNKGDGWVSEFVESLKTELESTFKEEISVYFDINPHDGLLETHDVDESLKDKLKCLIFIPVVSRTYCDPRAFAWEHEFKAFVEQASNDKFGLKVKLPNGNVASRVLPVQIHDLSDEDISMCQSVIGSVLRGIEFIYKSPGVNRPLRVAEDKLHENLNNTSYRDQINKVALAISEILSGLKMGLTDSGEVKSSRKESDFDFKSEGSTVKHKRPVGIFSGKYVQGSIILVAAVIIAAFVFYQKIFKKNPLEKLWSSEEKIVVVTTPFENNTNDTLWNVWQNGIQSELITYLTGLEELKVRQQQTVNNLINNKGLTNYASITPSLSNLVARKLEANILISGNINQAGKVIRVNAQLTEPVSGEIIKSFQIEGPAKEEMIFNIVDSLSSQISSFLLISKMRQKDPGIRYAKPTDSPDAYRYFMYGQKAFNAGDLTTAINYYNQALDLDSNFYSAITMLATSYYNTRMYDRAKEWVLKVYDKREQMPISQRIHLNWHHALLFETPREEIKYLSQLLEIDEKNSGIYYELGRIYVGISEFDDAISAMQNVFEIYKKLGVKPRWVQDYIMLGYAYQQTGQYKKEEKLFRKAEKEFPDNMYLLQRQAILSLTEKDTVAAAHYLDKFESMLRDNSASEADIMSSLAYAYTDGGYLDKAEECYRKGLASLPGNTSMLNNLGWFLIKNDRNIEEGMILVDSALNIRPDNYYYLESKGLGLYKQDKYSEALELLEKAWNLRPVYNNESYLFLEKVKKAAAEQVTE